MNLPRLRPQRYVAASYRAGGDDGSVMAAAERLIEAGERFERLRAETAAQAEEWEAGRVAAQEAYFARTEALRATLGATGEREGQE